VYELAVTLAEAGRFADAERLFEGRFFPREEGGTDPRHVRLEVALARALATKDPNDVRRLAELAPGFENSARFNYLAGLAAQRAGDRERAEEHWRRAAAQGNNVQVAYAYEAAKRLPAFNEAEWRQRLVARLKVLSDDIWANPGTLEMWRGTILRALGRADEAKEAFTRAILLPDRYLSRYMARTERQQTAL
jgi:tetratricopeptide (TPR) repeat protein